MTSLVSNSEMTRVTEGDEGQSNLGSSRGSRGFSRLSKEAARYTRQLVCPIPMPVLPPSGRRWQPPWSRRLRMGFDLWKR